MLYCFWYQSNLHCFPEGRQSFSTNEISQLDNNLFQRSQCHMCQYAALWLNMSTPFNKFNLNCHLQPIKPKQQPLISEQTQITVQSGVEKWKHQKSPLKSGSRYLFYLCNSNNPKFSGSLSDSLCLLPWIRAVICWDLGAGWSLRISSAVLPWLSLKSASIPEIHMQNNSYTKAKNWNNVWQNFTRHCNLINQDESNTGELNVFRGANVINLLNVIQKTWLWSNKLPQNYGVNNRHSLRRDCK